jgi:hypothetical protein
VSPSLNRLLLYSPLWISVHLRGSVAIGIVYLMTVKPDLPRALFALGVSAVLVSLWTCRHCVVSGRKNDRRRELPERGTDDETQYRLAGRTPDRALKDGQLLTSAKFSSTTARCPAQVNLTDRSNTISVASMRDPVA